MTKDEKIVLAHDENFTRLALDSKSSFSSRFVGDLTFRELLGLPLKSGIRPPLLIDVLRSASAISPDSKLVIEIKPGNDSVAAALARMLVRHPDLCPSVAMIMSFDAVTMHRLRAELSILKESVNPNEGNRNSNSSGAMHTRVSSFDHFGTMNIFGSSAYTRISGLFDSHPGSIGLSLSTANLEGMNNTSALSSPFRDSEADQVSLTPKKISLIPKLMLLTVSDPPLRACEHQVSIVDARPVDSWLKRPDGELDGVYLQFEDNMMTPEGALRLKELSQRYLVGIWAYSGKDPDDAQTASWLVNEGKCTFVNTDLPNQFRNDTIVRT
jgi:hypothetical protein